MISTIHAFKQDHLGRAQVNAFGAHALKRQRVMADASGRTGVRRHMHLETLLRECRCGLPYTHVRFNAADDQLLALIGLDRGARARCIPTAKMAFFCGRQSTQVRLQLIDGWAQFLRQLFGPDDGNVQQPTALDQDALRSDHAVDFVHQSSQSTLHINQHKLALVGT